MNHYFDKALTMDAGQSHAVVSADYFPVLNHAFPREVVSRRHLAMGTREDYI
jgi:hypothetical protein